ncbi:MAG: HU family DNA-binding protein [Syntrophomonadaceae bacterium]|nr:HU family DNA-binding protein [Syntrophomonadaceae bacterium]
MHWTEVIARTAEQVGQSAEEAEKVLGAMLEVVSEAMKTDEIIYLAPDFGAFAMKDIEGKEVGAGGRQLTKSRRTPVFKSAARLKKHLRQSDEEYLHRLHETGRHHQAECVARSPRAPAKET